MVEELHTLQWQSLNLGSHCLSTMCFQEKFLINNSSPDRDWNPVRAKREKGAPFPEHLFI